MRDARVAGLLQPTTQELPSVPGLLPEQLIQVWQLPSELIQVLPVGPQQELQKRQVLEPLPVPEQVVLKKPPQKQQDCQQVLQAGS